MTRSSRGRGRRASGCGGTAARASWSLRMRAGARPRRPSFSSRLQASPAGRRRSRRICSCESTCTKQAYVDLSGSEMLATAIKGRMLLPNAFVSLNRSTGAMTGHRKAALCSLCQSARVLLRSKRSARRPSKVTACEISPKAGSVRVRCPSTKPVANRAAEGQPCARGDRRGAETTTDAYEQPRHPPVWRPS